jgi:hypothetical protein
MKKEWERSTRMVDYSQLTADLKNPIETNLKVMEEQIDPLCCIETVSTQIKSRLFSSKKKVVRVASIVTPKWLIQAFDEEEGKSELYARFLYLDKMEVSTTTVDLARKIGLEDHGIDVLSLMQGGIERVNLFIGLEPGIAANEFISVLKNAILKENK